MSGKRRIMYFVLLCRFLNWYFVSKGIPPPPSEGEPKPTPAELKQAFSSHINQKNGPDAPLMTKAMREKEEARLGIKKKEYNEVRCDKILTCSLVLPYVRAYIGLHRFWAIDPNTGPLFRQDRIGRTFSLEHTNTDLV